MPPCRRSSSLYFRSFRLSGDVKLSRATLVERAKWPPTPPPAPETFLVVEDGTKCIYNYCSLYIYTCLIIHIYIYNTTTPEKKKKYTALETTLCRTDSRRFLAPRYVLYEEGMKTKFALLVTKLSNKCL